MYDGMGSIIATQGTGGPKIMVDAHMDELVVAMLKKLDAAKVMRIRDFAPDAR
jgi:putative aminopeptidase FrvX